MVDELTFAIPPSIPLGSVFYAMIVANAPITPPDGWVTDQAGTQLTLQYWIGHKTIAASDLGVSHTWKFAGSTLAGGIVIAVEETTGVDRAGFAKATAAMTLNAPSVNPQGATDLLLCGYFVEAPVAIAMAPDLSPLIVARGPLSMALGAKYLTSGANTGAKTATWELQANCAALTVTFGGAVPGVLYFGSHTL